MTALPKPMAEDDVVREHQDGQARDLDVAHGVLTLELRAPRAVILEDYVRATFDGAIGDAPLPFKTQDDARLAVESQLTERFARPLNASEQTKVELAVLIEWNRRVQTAQSAKVAAFRDASDRTVQ